MKLRWSSRSTLFTLVSREERQAAVSVDVDSLMVVAIETPVGNVTAEQVVGEHAHQVIGHGKTLQEALRMAERYAKE